MTFSTATCSMQDFWSRMNHFDTVLLGCIMPSDRVKFNTAYQVAADSLHQAMGYRAEHLQEDRF